MMLSEMYPEKPMDSVGEGEKIFVKWHLFTLEGQVSKNLKILLNFIWNHKNRINFYDFLKPIEEGFHLKYIGRRISLYEEIIFFINKQTQKDVILKASRVRGSSLENIAAAKIGSQLNTAADVEVIINQGLIPAHLRDLLVKYL